MANRNTLHFNKIDSFRKWLSDNGYKIGIENTLAQEVLRWKGQKGEPMPIIFHGQSNQHLSCNESAIGYVKKFIRENKEN